MFPTTDRCANERLPTLSTGMNRFPSHITASREHPSDPSSSVLLSTTVLFNLVFCFLSLTLFPPHPPTSLLSWLYTSSRFLHLVAAFSSSFFFSSTLLFSPPLVLRTVYLILQEQLISRSRGLGLAHRLYRGCFPSISRGRSLLGWGPEREAVGSRRNKSWP